MVGLPWEAVGMVSNRDVDGSQEIIIEVNPESK